MGSFLPIILVTVLLGSPVFAFQTRQFFGSKSPFARPLLKSVRQKDSSLFGIPKLFRWLVDLYPIVVESVGKGTTENALSVDNFYLDMNGIIHTCTHSNADNLVLTSEKDMFIRIFAYTDRLYKLVRPKKLMFLAVDGVAPRAKMNQQRARRFRASKEREALLSEYLVAHGELPKSDSFDSNCITPGTEFMHKLSLAFRKWIEYKMTTDPFWKNGADVIFSGPDVPGEGEHKIMEKIRDIQQSQPNYQLGQLRHCMYGLDADLIMLSLVTHEPFFVLLREKQQLRRQVKDPLQYSPQDFELLEVSILRKMLETHFKNILMGKKTEDENMKLLASVREIEKSFSTKKSHLVGASNNTVINNNISKGMDIAVDKISPSNSTIKVKDPRRVIDDFVFMCYLIGNDFLPSLPHMDIADGSLNMMMDTYLDIFPMLGGHLVDKDKLHLPRLELFVQQLARREPLYFEQRAIDEKDPGYKGKGYKDHYYQIKFGLEPGDMIGRRKIVQAYIEGLAWVSRYYHHGCGSWTWFYPYLYAPLASDLINLGDIQINFPQGHLFTPLMQLLSVLPPQSGKFLPLAYADLMTNPLSPLAPYYPANFEVDANGKRNSWESVVMIPFIDESALVENVNLIDHAQNLTNMEKDRNQMGQAHHFSPLTTSQQLPEAKSNAVVSDLTNEAWGNALLDHEEKEGSKRSPGTHVHNQRTTTSASHVRKTNTFWKGKGDGLYKLTRPEVW